MQKSSASHLPDKHQSCWQLAAVQLTSWTTLPVIATSVLILQENSFLGAMLTILVANAILWFIRFGIIAMSYKKRQSTLDISRDYLGKFGAYCIAVLLVASTLIWFVAQTTAASSTLTRLISIQESPNVDQFLQMSVLLGIVSTFLCMEGIVLLRRLATAAFPILVLAFCIAITLSPEKLPQENTNPISLAGLSLVLGANLGITSDLPTFFRHSQSWRTAVRALFVIQLVSLGLGLLSLYFGSIVTRSFEINESLVLSTGSNAFRVALIVFVFFSVICANVANVYSASVGWEILAPSALVGRKEYLILGLGLTTIFIMISNIFSVSFFLNATDSGLVNLCIVLVLGYVIARWAGREAKPFDQGIYLLAWLLSTGVNVLQYWGIMGTGLDPLAVGVFVIVLTIALSLAIRRVVR